MLVHKMGGKLSVLARASEAGRAAEEAARGGRRAGPMETAEAGRASEAACRGRRAGPMETAEVQQDVR